MFIFNIFKSSFFKKSLILLVLLLLFIFVSALSYVKAVSSNIQDSVFRLHVIANSDSQKDQDLKYIVRDGVLEYINTLSEECKTKDELILIAKENISVIENLAQEIVYENGYSYSVNVEIGNFAFPTKAYGDISFPAGNYDALKIEIGNASGQNWWCVMFPPLCFIDENTATVSEDSKNTLKEALSEEEYSIISEKDTNIEANFKFKIVELFSKTFN